MNLGYLRLPQKPSFGKALRGQLPKIKLCLWDCNVFEHYDEEKFKKSSSFILILKPAGILYI